MAIIKCPECGHQVSEKAPTCPGCGVQIAGNVVRCQECGEVYLQDQPMCPSCHCPKPGNAAPRNVVTPQPQAEQPQAPADPETQPKKKSYAALIVSVIFALIVCGVAWYFYHDAKMSKEREDYEFAMKSTDPMVLQQYLDQYKDADAAHRDSIQAHLALLQQYDEDWTNAVVSGSRTELERYVREHPDSPHKPEALNKIDSLDYVLAQKDKTLEAYKAYIEQHPDGRYAGEVRDAMKAILDRQVTPEEEQIVKNVFRRFFQAINARNEDGLLATVAEQMTYLLTRPNATKSDVVTFMERLFKGNVSNLNWHIIDDYKIEKTPVGEDRYEYSVEFPAELVKNLNDGTTETTNYKITGVMNSEGKVSSFKMATTSSRQ